MSDRTTMTTIEPGPYVPVDLSRCKGRFAGGNRWVYEETVDNGVGVRVWELVHAGWKDGGADYERRDTADD